MTSRAAASEYLINHRQTDGLNDASVGYGAVFIAYYYAASKEHSHLKNRGDLTDKVQSDDTTTSLYSLNLSIIVINSQVIKLLPAAFNDAIK
jgi:hypothetical protein